MAASFLIAFGIALSWRGSWEPVGTGGLETASIGTDDSTDDSTDDGAGDSTDDIVTSGRSLAVSEAAVENLVNDGVLNDGVVNDGVDPLRSPIPISDSADVAAQRPIEVPVISVGNAGDNWQADIGSVLPRHIVETLRGTGHQIESHRGFHTIQLRDGRRVVIPVEQVDVQFSGRQVHQ